MIPPATSEHPSAGLVPASRLTRRRKAAIIVRLLLGDGIDLPLDRMPPALQTALTDEIAAIRYVDSATLHEVVQEFLDDLDRIGLSFPGGLDGAMDLVGQHLSPEAAAQIKARQSGATGPDPWADLAGSSPADLAGLLTRESPEIAAVALSKLPRDLAAATLGKMPALQAQRIVLALSTTGNVTPAAVARIGTALATSLADTPAPAFDAPAEARMGAILDIAPASTRDSVLDGLAETDADLARRVRQAVFTFADIPDRLLPRDVAALARAVPQEQLVTALCGDGTTERASAEFILSNMPTRLAEQMREAMAERLPPPTAEEIETASSALTAALRRLDASGEIRLTADAGTTG
ncbi:FliG C-terminal domain-containing protein [Rhodovulum adriaticum]|uniref:Flagellar motor switch protein FliG n=1 Tax=Rhodovulum adriaticum TaxID=35804 RepID=A0A4R2NUC8_RHOAD|nr:FliG C-terminal domain-containing protein [Rhodovulum adriaticum]TCP25507.1 flagellar motor switch protein FliG [Rhodovulum adriaticum]